MVIRDNVHGDIEIPAKFVCLINTKEFQRLRRIKQLATAEQVFPGATHSRFTHSIGTFYVMDKIINHFEKILVSIGQEQCIDKQEKDIILAAALLHDIGHGPFSHAFEQAKISTTAKYHEDWTKEIILNTDTEIHAELEKWGENTARRVVDYINYRVAAKKNEEENAYDNGAVIPNFKFIFASLVSSQLDADRMDYLLRDSYNCGVSFGKFDLENLITGMGIGIDGDGEFRVCIKKSYLAHVEEYFYSRYQMYRNIYFHPYKVLSETLLEKILGMACSYYIRGKLDEKYIPSLILKIFSHADIALEDYLQLDDTVVMGAIHTWSHVDIDDLRKLCCCFLYRVGYKQILLTDVDSFLTDVEKLLRNENVTDAEAKKDLIFIKCVNSVKMYDKTGKKPVFILDGSGKVKELAAVSGLLGETQKEQTLYYNQEFCQYYLPSISEKVEKLLQDYDIRRSVEIEKKYIVEEDIYNQVITMLERKRYSVQATSVKEQNDLYFDTDDYLLYDNNYTLRIRKRDMKYCLTFKSPSDSISNGEGGQLERNEIERDVDTLNLNDHKEIVDLHFGKFLSEHGVECDDLVPKIEIINNRRKITATKSFDNEDIIEEKYEIVFDDVKYDNKKNGKAYCEKQMEIELKSSPETRINMKGLTDELEREVKTIKSISDSKYHRAVAFTEKE